MKNKTASILNVVAYTIWILGGLGSMIIGSSIAETFRGTIFEEIGKSISMSMFLSTAFSVFTTGLLFYALAVIINLIEAKLPNNAKVDQLNNETILGASGSDDILKF